MKYLKVFEDFGFKNYIRSIIGEEKRFQNREDLNDKSFNEIKNFLVKNNIPDFKIVRKLDGLSFWMPYSDGIDFGGVKSSQKYIRIESYKDEWYLLSDFPLCYECDQIYGVINCLKSLLPNNPITESIQSDSYYKEISQDTFDELLTNPNIYTFSNKDLIVIRKFAEDNSLDFQISAASIFVLDGIDDEWYMKDKWDLDKCIESPSITIHTDNKIKKFNYTDVAEEEDIFVYDFTIRLVMNPWLNDQSIKQPIIDIMKCEDEWYIVCIEYKSNFDSFFMYKCDQIEGVINLLKKFTTELLIKESNIESKYYSEISEDEFMRLYNWDYEAFYIDELVDFSKDEVQKIKDIFYKQSVYIFNDYNYANEDNQAETNNGIIVVNDRKDFILGPGTNWSGTLFYAINTNDEWIYAMDFNNQKYYKCDQFDGLLKFIKDKFIYSK